MEPSNSRVAVWLDQGRVREVLVGSGKYHLEDYDYPGAHDVMLATSTLIQWAVARGKQKETAEQLEAVLTEIAIDDPYMAGDLMLAYAINACDLQCDLGAKFERVLSLLDSAIEQGDYLERSTREAIARLRPILAERLAEVQEIGNT